MDRRTLSILLVLCLAQLLPAQPPPPLIQPDVFGFEVLIGTPVSVQFTVSNPPSGGVNSGWAVTSGTLPPGISLTPGGLMSGTPTTAQSSSFTITTVYTFPFSSFVVPPLTLNRTYYFNTDTPFSIVTPAQLPPATAGVPMARTISASSGAGWYIGASTLPQSISFTLPVEWGPAISISGTFPPVAAPTIYTFLVQATGGDYVSQTVSRNFSIAVNPAPQLRAPAPTAVLQTPYDSALPVTGGTGPFTFEMVAGALPPGLSLDPATGAIRGTPPTLGAFAFTARLTDSNGAIAILNASITVVPPQLEITTTALPSGRAGDSYSASIAVQGGTPPYSFERSFGALPPGLTLSSTGSLTGTPTQPGSFWFIITVRDNGQQTASAQYTVVIAPAPLGVLTSRLPAAILAKPYSIELAALGGKPPYSWTLSGGSLPAGFTLSSDGTLSGTGGAAGAFDFTVTVRDSEGSSASKPLTLTVAEDLRFLTGELPVGALGAAYQAAFSAAGGLPPYAFTLSQGTLPPGLALSSGGAISGTPSAAGDFSFTARVTDSDGRVSDGVFLIHVAPPPAITTASLPDAIVGVSYSGTLSGTGTEPLAWSVTSGSLPPGLALNPATGAITGKPSAAGAFPLTITLSDGNRSPLTASRQYTIQVNVPDVSPLSITQLQDAVAPGSQPSFGMLLASATAAELNGTATLTFTPDSGLPADPDVRFSNGGSTVDFTIPAGQAAATPASGSLFAFQTGTTAGVITIRATLRAGSVVLSPDPYTTRTLRINPAAPSISSVRIVRTAGGFDVQVTGFSNTRAVTGATFRFTAASGGSLGTTEVSVPVQSLFQTWFASATSQNYGGQFLLTVPFTVQGNAAAIASVQVTLTNGVGSTSASASF